MGFVDFFNFFLRNTMFSFSTILVGFGLSFLLYDKIVTKGINLKSALFDKDNFAAWLEFTGAFVFPVLYISSKALAGSVSENIWIDLLISLAYVASYVVLFTLLRLTSGLIVKVMGCSDQDGKVSLNNEIYTQHNVASSMFSIALSILFANIATFLDPHPEFIVASLLKICVVLMISLAALAGYTLILGRKTTLAKEIFEDNNAAAGIELAGFMFAVQIILAFCINIKEALTFTEIIIVSCIDIAILGILACLFNILFAKILKIDLWEEIYQQNNSGAAFGRVALYVGIASVIVNFLG